MMTSMRIVALLAFFMCLLVSLNAQTEGATDQPASEATEQASSEESSSPASEATDSSGTSPSPAPEGQTKKPPRSGMKNRNRNQWG
ncbi:uncharacterized protein LOC141855910 [Brevipalpus obovatus]|uniref:uncharacterized protein LOC141855910 n=1 Tax=Brevipalpus obovatus TaxID=246614 RepID=UPI003D9EE972